MALDEFVEFDETIEMVMSRINTSDTLVIVTADHRFVETKIILTDFGSKNHPVVGIQRKHSTSTG